MQTYDIIVERDFETKQYYAHVPLLPGCYSYADSLEELLENMKEAISLHLEVLKTKKDFVITNEFLGIVKVSI
jgi:predicted RNase H-like HicB family nuclease